MPHSHQKKLFERRPTAAAAAEVRRRQTKVKFLTVTGNPIQDSPAFFETPEFHRYSKYANVQQFVSDFWHWNEKVLWLVNSTSAPYIELQTQLAHMAAPHLKGTVVDLGCGAGDFMVRLMSLGMGQEINRIFAIDIDWVPLAQIPENLKNVGYRDKVALIQSSTMSKAPVWDEVADCVVSSLGGVMYSGWWFDEDGNLICENRDALVECLKDVNRMLKPGGHLVLSAPRPNPDWGKILKSSLLHSLSHFNIPRLARAIKYGSQAKAASAFMNELDNSGRAHYLTLEDWSEVLSQTGFEIIDSSFGQYYAKQGVIVIARKL